MAETQEAAEAERELGKIFEEGVLMVARTLWQEASRRQQRAYPRYAMSRGEYRRQLRMHDRKVRAKEAFEHDDVLSLVGEVVPLVKVAPDDELTPRIAGELLRSVSYFLCIIGKPACPGDLETFLRDAWDTDSTRAERRHIRSYGGRATLLMLLNTILFYSCRDMCTLSEQRGASALQYIRFDAGEGFVLDREVLDTFYFGACSLLQLVEGEPGNA